MDVADLIIRLFIAFFVLLTLTRIMGRKEISQMTSFNFASSIAIGSIAANLAIDNNLTIRNGVIALVVWTIFTLIMAFIDIKFKGARKFTTGEPIIVIKDGQIMDKALKKAQLDLNSLTSMLREKDVFSLKDVDYAFFETSGKLSVLKKEQKQPVTKEDVSIPIQKKLYRTTIELISDGEINMNNLIKVDLSQTWLDQQLKSAGINSIADVFIAELQTDGSLYIDKKKDGLGEVEGK
ncbi:uncharacterized membrane protein YcaP [Ureibacillus xyleni]|uniref:Uncharacterized membrane protein YcaP n=1 Tax=Ureibacillus xyleni TaxID=614648 RepID=A0A285TN17_9BACL|nr:DUF421 domain-containing protein [Ureibacillus xyleni]SOC23950.1 uncharacterized membrane protein YcaP [Ureibacillus xyleni]